MRSGRQFLVVGMFVTAALMVGSPLAAEEQPEVLTVFRVLVGKPEASAAAATQVLDIPGPIVMLGRSAEEEARDVLQLMGKLKDSYRLASVEIGTTQVVRMTKGQEAKVALPGEAVQATVTLLGLDDSNALFGVGLVKEGEKPSNSRVLIGRGERGVVGTRDGAAAPYLFLTIEPLPYSKKLESAPAEYPTLVNRVTPRYPEDARKAKVGGVVVLECTVDAEGVVRDLKPVRTEPMGLTEAAIAAVSQWRYKPARDASGKPIATPLTLTISFIVG